MRLIVNASLLTEAVKARNMTPKSVASAACISERHVRALMAGEKPVTAPATAAALARVLRIDVDLLARPEATA